MFLEVEMAITRATKSQ